MFFTAFFTAVANSRIVFGVVTLVGMVICSAGIGKAARLGLWVHPVTLAGYVLGGSALLLAVQGLFRLQLLPLTNVQSLVAILAIVVLKIVLATFYPA
jgi:hypothetical protein